MSYLFGAQRLVSHSRMLELSRCHGDKGIFCSSFSLLLEFGFFLFLFFGSPSQPRRGALWLKQDVSDGVKSCW